jgi:hypothetical protein
MKLVHDWYMIQTAAVDPKARKLKFDDSLMGELIRFVSSHEVGHTLGLRHNMGSRSKTPVELLRNKAWVEANGHTASIMDYARFNYVAQPEDNISEAGLFPRIGDNDKWAIQWGYTYTGISDPKIDELVTNKWAVDSLKNPRLWFGGERRNVDPRAQTEDLGDDAVKASNYGIMNLKRILVQLPVWTKEEADKYQNLSDMYQQLVGQFARYLGHVTKNVGGIEETFKSVEQKGDVYAPTPKEKQKAAVAFLNAQLFQTPTWLLDKEILNKISYPTANEAIQNLQVSTLNSLLDAGRLYRLQTSRNRFGNGTYGLDEMMDDVQKGIFSEIYSNKPIDAYHRNLQKAYVAKLIELIDPTKSNAASLTPTARGFNLSIINTANTDVPSVARGELKSLLVAVNAAIPATSNKLSKYHLQDLSERIKKALDPKS